MPAGAIGEFDEAGRQIDRHARGGGIQKEFQRVAIGVGDDRLIDVVRAGGDERLRGRLENRRSIRIAAEHLHLEALRRHAAKAVVGFNFNLEGAVCSAKGVQEIWPVAEFMTMVDGPLVTRYVISSPFGSSADAV